MTRRTRPPARTPSRSWFRAKGELGEQGAARRFDPPLAGSQQDVIAGGKPACLALDREGSGILQGVGEDRSDAGAEDHAALTFVGNVRDVMTDVPEQGVHRALPRRPGTHHVPHQGDGSTGTGEPRELTDGIVDVGPVVQQGEGVERYVGPRPRLGRRGQIVGGGFAVDPEDAQVEHVGDGRTTGEPPRLGPGPEYRTGVPVTGPGQGHHVVEGVEDQGGGREGLAGRAPSSGLSSSSTSTGTLKPPDMVPSRSTAAVGTDGVARSLPSGHRGQVGRLDPCRVIDARRDPVGEQTDEGGGQMVIGRTEFPDQPGDLDRVEG